MKNKRVDFIITPEVIEEVKDLIEAHKKQIATGIVDYYEIFKVSPSLTAEALKKSVDIQRWEFILQDRNALIYGLDAVQLAEYKKIVKSLADFKGRVLSSENSKKTYDKDLAETKRASELKHTAADFAYVPEILDVDTNKVLTASENALYKLAVKSIALQGASKTVMMLANLLVDKTKVAVPTELKDEVDKMPMSAIVGELVKKHGKKGVVSIVCDELDEMFSRKTAILTEALALTEKKYDKDQCILALKNLMIAGIPTSFVRYTDTTKGRDKITMEIKQEFVKYVIAAYMAEDKDLRAMNDPIAMASMYWTDEEIEEIVTRMLPEKKLFSGFNIFRGFRK